MSGINPEFGKGGKYFESMQKIITEDLNKKSENLNIDLTELENLKKLKENVEKDLLEQFGEDFDDLTEKDFINEKDKKDYEFLKSEQNMLSNDIIALENKIKLKRLENEKGN